MRRPLSTISYLLLAFQRANYDLSRLGRPPKRPFKCIPDDVKEALLEPRLLQLLAPFSLRERVAIIEKVFGQRARFSKWTLGNFYRANGVSYRAAKQVYEQSRYNLPGREQARTAFAQLLGALIVTDRPLIYVDEAHFHTQSIQKKSWSTRESPNQHPIAAKRFSTTAYAAVGNCLQRPVYACLKGMNATNFIKFLHKIAGQVRPGVTRPVLVYDGHPAHKSPGAQRIMQLYFEPCNQTPYSSPFNAVETIWSMGRRNFHKRMLMNRLPRSQRQLHRMVLDSLEEITREQVHGALMANRAYIRRYLS